MYMLGCFLTNNMILKTILCEGWILKFICEKKSFRKWFVDSNDIYPFWVSTSAQRGSNCLHSALEAAIKYNIIVTSYQIKVQGQGLHTISQRFTD